jgi:hypothetical protein
MKIEELKKHVEHELNWLLYYATLESRKNLNNELSIYNQLISIGYVKKQTNLDRRCTSAWVKLPTTSSKIEEVIISTEPRDIKNNIYTALEAWIILYPENFDNIKRYILGEISIF